MPMNSNKMFTDSFKEMTKLCHRTLKNIIENVVKYGSSSEICFFTL